MNWFEDYFRAPLSRAVSPTLKRIFGPLDDFLLGLPPSVWLACAIGLFLIAGIAVWCLKRNYVYLGAPDEAPWRDLRIWATILLLPYIAIYLLLGR
jgi:hypothetical protein